MSKVTRKYFVSLSNCHDTNNASQTDVEVVSSKELEALEAELEDWRSSQRTIMDEVCPSDEKHCTCVPILRRKVESLEKQLTFEKQANYAGTIKQLSEDKVALEKRLKELTILLSLSHNNRTTWINRERIDNLLTPKK